MLEKDPSEQIAVNAVRASGCAQQGDCEHWTRRRALGGHVHLDATDRWLMLSREDSALLLWVSYDVDWVQIDEIRLWRFIESCRQRECGGVILARKIETPVFPLLKALGLQGLQYYSCWTRNGFGDHIARIRDDLNWIHVRELSEVNHHPVLANVRAAVGRTATVNKSSAIGDAIHDASIRGFAGARKPTLRDILDWWRASGLPIPEKTADLLDGRVAR